MCTKYEERLADKHLTPFNSTKIFVPFVSFVVN